MDIKVPFLHQHFLLLDEYENQEAICDKCHQEINGWAYNCESCNFWLHYSCFEEQLPPQISHPAHFQHLLTLSTVQTYGVSFSVCNICFTLCRGHVYTCNDCNFKVDVLCASKYTIGSETSENEISQRSDHDRHDVEDFKHFVHRCRLALFNYRKVAKYENSCTWCGKFLSGICYGCYYCYPDFLFHKSCLLNIPFRIFRHPFHPWHPLHIQEIEGSRCHACNDRFQWGDAYICQKCDFSLHVLCARLQPSLKHDVHEHTLTYIPKKISFYEAIISYQCNMCHKNIPIPARFEKGNFYRCVPCNINFHLECVPIPPKTIHRYHKHDLMFVDSFVEDESGEYFCDICEEERNSKYPIYCCKECTYISHIHCALNKVDSKTLIPKTTGQEKADKKTDRESQTDHLELEYKQIEVFFHKHPLSFYEVNEEEELMYCKACNLEILSQGYACERCKYYLHKTCTKLPYEMLHPLHPQHSLNLLANTYQRFTCDECRSFPTEEIEGFGYVCYQCNFKLDVKCALNLTIPTTDEDQRLKRMKRHMKSCLFNQAHKLEVNVYTFKLCSLCLLPERGPMFHCKLCGYNIHESCFKLIPWKIEVPVHPAHPLHPEVPRYYYKGWCQVCGQQDSASFEIFYSCQNCPNLKLHLPCANSLKRAIIVKGSDQSHEHYLFYYGAKWQEAFSHISDDFSEECNGCGESFAGKAFYHCLICRINLHLKCVSIPRLIQSKCHIHPFILKDLYVEDDFGEYYCDVCEEERHPDDHVYFCKQCAFVAHLECVLKQVEEITLAAETYSNLEIDVERLPYPKLLRVERYFMG